MLVNERSERVAHICEQLGAKCYVSGPAASAYLKEEMFNKKGIKVLWFDYAGYPPYTQKHGEFTHNVSILDLLFMCGPSSPSKMKFGRTL